MLRLVRNATMPFLSQCRDAGVWGLRWWWVDADSLQGWEEPQEGERNGKHITCFRHGGTHGDWPCHRPLAPTAPHAADPPPPCTKSSHDSRTHADENELAPSNAHEQRRARAPGHGIQVLRSFSPNSLMSTENEPRHPNVTPNRISLTTSDERLPTQQTNTIVPPPHTKSNTHPVRHHERPGDQGHAFRARVGIPAGTRCRGCGRITCGPPHYRRLFTIFSHA